MSEIDNLYEEVQQLSDQAEYDYTSDKGSKYRDKILQVIKRIDLILTDEAQFSKSERVKLYFLKGKVYDILPEYSRQAEDALTKSMKLAPHDPDNLITLGHILWKKKDIMGAKQCFENAIEQSPKHIKALQYLSIVLRQVGEGKERQESVAQSVKIAKQALMHDLQNSQSWYLLGNAYVSDYFTNLKKSTEQLQQALKAYNQSESKTTHQNPDLYFNRANVLSYFEDYQQAFNDYERAYSIDNSLIMDKVIDQRKKILQIQNLLESKCHIALKKLNNIVKQIPTGLKKQPFGGQQEYKLSPLSDLKEGRNDGTILSCKSLKSFTNPTNVPAGFVILDSTSYLGVLSVYNCSEDIYEKIHDNTDIYIVDPIVKSISVRIDDQDIKYMVVQVFEINKMFVQDEMVTSAFSPSIAINQTFEK